MANTSVSMLTTSASSSQCNNNLIQTQLKTSKLTNTDVLSQYQNNRKSGLIHIPNSKGNGLSNNSSKKNKEQAHRNVCIQAKIHQFKKMKRLKKLRKLKKSIKLFRVVKLR